MRITADTNLLVRALTGDNVEQGMAAMGVLESAEFIAVPTSTLCELAWVLSRGYKHSSAKIAEAIRRLTNAANVVVDAPATEAGLAMLELGGDFADGVIAHEGSWLGADIFVSFDKRAVKLLQAQGKRARLLG